MRPAGNWKLREGSANCPLHEAASQQPQCVTASWRTTHHDCVVGGPAGGQSTTVFDSVMAHYGLSLGQEDDSDDDGPSQAAMWDMEVRLGGGEGGRAGTLLGGGQGRWQGSA